MSRNPDIIDGIRRKALELGFSACGFSTVRELTEVRPLFLEWLAEGRAGEMNYLTRNVEVRLNPALLLEGAQTIISLAAPYHFEGLNRSAGAPAISRYAMGDDYHTVLKNKGHELLQWIRSHCGDVKGRVFTDSAPLFERDWARRAGLGWIGKNGCLIIPHQGSWFFLAEVLIDLELSEDSVQVPDRCGNCTRCIDACPTSALVGDGSIDPRKCISYLTIEHRSAIPDLFRDGWNDWIFGCDICQEVCPWNRQPIESTIESFRPREALALLTAADMAGISEERFIDLFDGTPVMRAGRSGILRNFEFLHPKPEE